MHLSRKQATIPRQWNDLACIWRTLGKTSMASELATISIADALAALRDQIVEARKRGEDHKGVQFTLRDVAVEFQIVAERTIGADAKGSVKWGVFGLGGDVGTSAKTESSNSMSHKLSLKLDVTDAVSSEPIPLNR